MSILIKGMEMPKEGSWVTLRVFPDGQCFIYSWHGNDFDFMEYLTAATVPPHGDLIDRDALLRSCPTNLGAPIYAINEAPTVIPTEEVYVQGYDTAGNYHWTGTHTGEHIIPAEEGAG